MFGIFGYSLEVDEILAKKTKPPENQYSADDPCAQANGQMPLHHSQATLHRLYLCLELRSNFC